MITTRLLYMQPQVCNGRTTLILRELFGGKAAGCDFSNHLCSSMEFLNLESCPADPNIWMQPTIESDGTILYVDDTLVASENAGNILKNKIGRYIHMKEESIGLPKIYLGGHVHKVHLENGISAWGFCSSQ